MNERVQCQLCGGIFYPDQHWKTLCIPCFKKSKAKDNEADTELAELRLENARLRFSLTAGEVETGDLYASYRNWALESGLKPASKVSLGRRLSERGYAGRKSSNKRYWVGMSLNANNSGGYSYEK